MNARASSAVNFPSPFVSAAGNCRSNLRNWDSDCEKTTVDMHRKQMHRWKIFMSRCLRKVGFFETIESFKPAPRLNCILVIKGEQKDNKDSSSTDLTKNELLPTLWPFHGAWLIHLNSDQFDRIPRGRCCGYGRGGATGGYQKKLQGKGRAFRRKILRALPRQPGSDGFAAMKQPFPSGCYASACVINQAA